MDFVCKLERDFSLKHKTTFGSDIHAHVYLNCLQGRDLFKILEKYDLLNLPRFILGNGSNVLFSKNYEGVVIQLSEKTIIRVNEDSKNVWIRATAAVEWNDLVDFCVANKFYGIENLALIPGTVGASVVQNIGAYGAEVQSFVEEVEVLDLENGNILELKNLDCNFAYRYSIFKEKKNFLILSVLYKLSLNGVVNCSYKGISENLLSKSINNPTLEDVRNAVVEVRQRKLPDYKQFPNAGSFFKNPIISNDFAIEFAIRYPEAPIFNFDEYEKKISAAWLISKCGWKGKGNSGANVSEMHALVLVRQENGSGQDVFNLANSIIADVNDKFEIILEPEVEIL